MKLVIAAIVMWSGVAVADGRLGVTVDVGVPDGSNAALVVRPVRPVRLHLGAGYNGISQGYRAGVTLVPFGTWFSPTLSLDVGQYVEGNANPLVRMVTRDTTFNSAVLEHVGYRYANAHLGLEFGRKWATFYIHGGVSRVTGRVHELLSSMDMSDPTVSVTLTDPVVTITSVSARIGLIVYFH